jgi:mannosyltransferase
MNDTVGYPDRVPGQSTADYGAADRGRAATARLSTTAVDVGIVTVVALALGLVRLGSPSFWVDESFTARALTEWSIWQWAQGYHFLYYVLLRPWIAVVGTSETALRFPSVLGAAAAAALLVVLGRKLFDRRVALVAGLLLAASPFVVKWSQQARGYTILLALSILAMLMLVRALERGRQIDWALYGLTLSALFVWHPVGGLVVVPAHVALAYQRRGRLLPHALLAVVLVAVIGVPWAAQIAMRSTGEGVAMNWLTFPSTRTIVETILAVSGAAGLGILLAVIGLIALRRAGEGETAWWLGIWAVSPFVVALLVSTFRPIYLDRYLIVAAPAFALLGGIAIMGVASRWRVALASVVVIATAVGLARWYTIDGNWRGEDWRSAVRMITERRADADAIVVAPWSAAPAARYYGADPVDVSSAKRIWVLRWSETADDITPPERQALGFGAHALLEKLAFGRRLSAELWVRPS